VDLKALERPIEGDLKPGQVANAPVRGADEGEGLALEGRQASEPGRLLDDIDQVFVADRLQDVAQGSILYGLDGGLQGGGRSDDDHRHVEVFLSDRPEQLDSVHARHGEIGQDDIEAASAEELDPSLAIAGGLDVVAGRREHLPPHEAQIRLIVN